MGEKKLIEDEKGVSKKEEEKGNVAVAPTLTTRQQEAALAAKEKEEKEKLEEEDNLKADWLEREAVLNKAISDYQRGVSVQCLGRDRAFRRFWVFDSVPGVFVEHDDDLIGDCREEPTPWDPEAVVEPMKCLLKHKDGWPFDRPITKADAPDYHLCVRNPMDLGTVRGKLNDMQYTSNQEVINDIRLVFSNCYSYNMEDAEEYGCAER